MSKKAKHTLGYILIIGTLILSGCGKDQASHTGNAKQTFVGGDIREEAANKESMPSFLKEADPRIRAVYAHIPDNQEMLQYIPCYCGCGESVGHKSNLECFVHEFKPDGSLVWDSHATTCNACLSIAAESITMRHEGKSYQEIRTFIDTKYKEGYAKPTSTPMPPNTH